MIREVASGYRANLGDRQIRREMHNSRICTAAAHAIHFCSDRQSMSRLSSFLFGMVAGAGLLQGVTTYHIVRASDGFHFVAKQPPRLGETYVDIRAFTMTDWAARPQLASALVQANQQQLLGDSAATAVQERAKQLLPDWPKK